MLFHILNIPVLNHGFSKHTFRNFLSFEIWSYKALYVLMIVLPQ